LGSRLASESRTLRAPVRQAAPVIACVPLDALCFSGAACSAIQELSRSRLAASAHFCAPPSHRTRLAACAQLVAHNLQGLLALCGAAPGRAAVWDNTRNNDQDSCTCAAIATLPRAQKHTASAPEGGSAWVVGNQRSVCSWRRHRTQPHDKRAHSAWHYSERQMGAITQGAAEQWQAF